MCQTFALIKVYGVVTALAKMLSIMRRLLLFYLKNVHVEVVLSLPVQKTVTNTTVSLLLIIV